MPKGQIAWNKGKRMLWMCGDNNPSRQPGIGKKISEAKRGKPTWNKGRHLTEEWKKKIGLANKRLITGIIKSCKQCKKDIVVRPSYVRMFCSRVCYGKYTFGASRKLWGISESDFARKNERNDPAYKQWRIAVIKRDENKCKMRSGCGGKTVVHHILPWSQFPNLRYEVNNGITLCLKHHPRTRKDEKRHYKTFEKLVMQNLSKINY